jgi:hypothetical protein
MGRRGTTVVAWMIGLGAFAAQAVLSRIETPVEVTAPALQPAPQAEPVTDLDNGAKGDGIGAEVIALIR